MGPRDEVVDESIDQDLRREDAHEGHVVLDAEWTPGPYFPDEMFHRLRRKDAVAAHLRG